MKIGVTAIGGRMGKLVAEEVIGNDLTDLSGALTRQGYEEVGTDIGLFLQKDPVGVNITDSLDALFTNADVVIDFSAPEQTRQCILAAATAHKPLVCGTTGLTPEDKQLMKEHSIDCPILYSTNMSVGINLLLSITANLAKKLYEGYDIEIVEAHHRSKVDAPSGTALALGEAAAQGRGWNPLEVFRHPRWGQISKRSDQEIGFSVIRGGDLAGKHEVMFIGENESITLTHESFNHAIYAQGAVRAAIWLYGKRSGLYSMQDVLAIHHQ